MPGSCPRLYSAPWAPARTDGSRCCGRVIVHCSGSRKPSSAAFNLLVLVDQDEEIFTYVEAGGAQADESEAFVNRLLASRAERASRIHVAINMRRDFLGNCVRFLDLPEAINKAQYLAPRLMRDQLEKAIVGPARVFGGDVDPAVVLESVNAVENNPDQLPVLQHALSRMWAEAQRADQPLINRAALKAVGGVKEALHRHAQEVFADLGEDAASPSERYSLPHNASRRSPNGAPVMVAGRKLAGRRLWRASRNGRVSLGKLLSRSSRRLAPRASTFLAASKRQSRRFAWVASLAILCAGAAGIFA